MCCAPVSVGEHGLGGAVGRLAAAAYRYTATKVDVGTGALSPTSWKWLLETVPGDLERNG